MERKTRGRERKEEGEKGRAKKRKKKSMGKRGIENEEYNKERRGERKTGK